MVTRNNKQGLLNSLKTYGWSMFPLLHDEDIVYLTKYRFTSLKPNDIICFKKNNVTQTHRIIYKTEKYFVTKGDNNLKADGRIYPRQIIGKVYQVKRQGKIFNPDDLYLYQSTLYFQEIVKVKTAFEKAGIDFVFLKGLPLHLYYEKTYPRRYYADCDLLIDKHKLSLVESLFNKCGYKKNDLSLTKLQKKLKNEKKEVSFYRTINGVYITFDIHLEPVFMMVQLNQLNVLYPQKKIDEMTDEFLKNKQYIYIQETKFPLLSPSHQILYLALHFFHDNYRGIYKLELLHNVQQFHKRKFNLTQKIYSLIDKYKFQNFLSPTFYLLNTYYPSPFAKNVVTMIHSHQKVNSTLLKRNVFDSDTRIHSGIERFRNIYHLSPHSLNKKIFVFLNPQVISLLGLLILRRVSSLITLRR